MFQDLAKIFQDLAKILQVLARSSKKSKIESNILPRYQRRKPRSYQENQDVKINLKIFPRYSRIQDFPKILTRYSRCQALGETISFQAIRDVNRKLSRNVVRGVQENETEQDMQRSDDVREVTEYSEDEDEEPNNNHDKSEGHPEMGDCEGDEGVQEETYRDEEEEEGAPKESTR